jgi:hypothetical protein
MVNNKHHRFGVSPINKTHGESGLNITVEYRCWQHIKTRCTNPRCKEYKNYGGRGIKICERWMKFENFLEDMGRREKGMTIDRKDVNGDYCPENCTWSNWITQSRNKRNSVFLNLNGENKTLAEWSDISGIKRTTLWMRLFKYGWTLEKAIIK